MVNHVTRRVFVDSGVVQEVIDIDTYTTELINIDDEFEKKRKMLYKK